MRLNDYLARVGVAPPLTCDVDTLRRVHRAHREAFLFENLSIQMGGTVSLELQDLERKFLDDRRGGYCFEHNTLFSAALADLEDRFSGPLEFGTAGLRGLIGAGLARMNRAVVIRTTAGLVDYVKQLQPRLAKSGLCIVDSPRTLLDVTTRELVVPEPSVPYDASVIAELGDSAKLGSELPWIRPGRYPLHTWFLTRGPEHLGELSPAVAVTSALPTLFDLDDLVGEVERLADLFLDVEPYGIWYGSADELVDQVTAALA